MASGPGGPSGPVDHGYFNFKKKTYSPPRGVLAFFFRAPVVSSGRGRGLDRWTTIGFKFKTLPGGCLGFFVVHPKWSVDMDVDVDMDIKKVRNSNHLVITDFPPFTPLHGKFSVHP